eukprot:2220406-Amphidinium_carterae.1
MAEWIRHRPTEPGFVGSSPCGHAKKVGGENARKKVGDENVCKKVGGENERKKVGGAKCLQKGRR